MTRTKSKRCPRIRSPCGSGPTTVEFLTINEKRHSGRVRRYSRRRQVGFNKSGFIFKSREEICMRDIKSFPIQNRSGGGQAGEFTGYAFHLRGSGSGVAMSSKKGAFRKTLLGRAKGRIPILDHHDPTRQIGWNLEAQEDDRGLAGTADYLDLNVRVARENAILS